MCEGGWRAELKFSYRSQVMTKMCDVAMAI